MVEPQPEQGTPTESPLQKGRNKFAPDREGARQLMPSRARAGKLGEIVKEMKVATVVADRIVALATQPKSKSRAKLKHPAVLAKARHKRPQP
jgi:hypothetical protein